jgi:hypothetical protein
MPKEFLEEWWVTVGNWRCASLNGQLIGMDDTSKDEP